jgi:hypothetical protein
MKSSYTLVQPSVHRLIFCLMLMIPQASTGQVLISLVLGDDLNSGKVEFGLDGGASIISQQGTGSLNNFNLGFYFDIKINDSWMYHTGVIVKSTMGAGGLPVYGLGDAQLDDLFKEGHVDRTMNYFNVPFFIKYKTPSYIYIEAGLQLGLLYGARDQFKSVVNGEDLTYDVDVRNQFKALDAGVAGGVGYRLMKGNGMNLGIRYYLGFMNVSTVAGTEVLNRSLYLNIGIPIGKGKAREKREQKEKGSG